MARIFIIFTFCFFTLGCHSYSADKKVSLSSNGIQLYGAFRFESGIGSDAFGVLDLKGLELVPGGAVLMTIKEAYTIGYYEGEIHLRKGGQIDKLEKIFFVLLPNGAITFHRPSLENPLFHGSEIIERVLFK